MKPTLVSFVHFSQLSWQLTSDAHGEIFPNEAKNTKHDSSFPHCLARQKPHVKFSAHVSFRHDLPSRSPVSSAAISRVRQVTHESKSHVRSAFENLSLHCLLFDLIRRSIYITVMTLNSKQQWILVGAVCAMAVMMFGAIVGVGVYTYLRSDAKEVTAVGSVELEGRCN